ncbi:MAG: DUF5130 domain-containing protein [Actinomycetota bacterium]|nr:DUF5130 domain-containing protein [Actinomycetota bacterium]
MVAGEAFTVDQRRGIERAIQYAEAGCGLAFSVYVGPSEEDSRAHARRLLQQLPDPSRSVLLLVDPGRRMLEVVTGAVAQRTLTDTECEFAVLSMQACFSAGDLSGGIVSGLQQLGDHARTPTSLHTG